ncbi:MAG TPA: hypothetical protein O0X39_07115, partial [Methanocorpusculum sp.]|nr:hypothetical protein [Methanocorpusculum sp.]
MTPGAIPGRDFCFLFAFYLFVVLPDWKCTISPTKATTKNTTNRQPSVASLQSPAFSRQPS